MKKSVLLVVLVAATSFAGERFLGIITPRGGSASNQAAGADAGFFIPPMSKITVQCLNTDAGSASSYVEVDVTSTTAARGLKITGTQALPTSVGSPKVADGGNSAVVSIYSDQSDNCAVWERSGRE